MDLILRKLAELEKTIKDLLPKYILVTVYLTSDADVFIVKLKFPDGAAVADRYELVEDMEFDKVLAGNIVINILDKSISNMRFHIESLEKLKEDVVVKVEGY